MYLAPKIKGAKMLVPSISDYILCSKNYLPFLYKVKIPLESLINKTANNTLALNTVLPEVLRLCRKYPVPDYSNVIHDKSRRLIKLRDRFLNDKIAKGKKRFWKAIWDLIICEVDHDSFYGNRFDWLIEKISEMQSISRNGLESLKNKNLFYEKRKSTAVLFNSAWRILLNNYDEYESAILWFWIQLKEEPWEKRLPTRPSRDNWCEPGKARNNF